jgi:hypothetical protein
MVCSAEVAARVVRGAGRDGGAMEGVGARVHGAAMARIVCARRSMATFGLAIATSRRPPDMCLRGRGDTSLPATGGGPGGEVGGRFMQAVLGRKLGRRAQLADAGWRRNADALAGNCIRNEDDTAF